MKVEKLDLMHFVITIFCAVLVAFALADYISAKPEKNRLYSIEHDIYFYTDPETAVQYVVIEKFGKLAVCPRIDENGNPVLNPPVDGGKR